MFGVNSMFALGILFVLWDAKPVIRKRMGWILLALGLLGLVAEAVLYLLITGISIGSLLDIAMSLLTGTE